LKDFDPILSRFQYLKHKDINFQLWDECISRSTNGVVYACSWYLNIVSPGWHALVKMQGNEYKLVFPVTHFKKFGFSYIKQPDFANELGIFGNELLITEKDLSEVIDILKAKFKLISSYIFNVSNSHYFKNRFLDIKVEEVTHFRLKVDKDPKDIVANFEKYTRKNIRQALKQNLQISDEDYIEDLILMFKENTADRIYGGVSEIQYKILTRLYQEASRRRLGLTLMVKHYSKNIGGVFLLEFKNTIYYLFSTVNEEGRLRNANSLIIYKILENKDSNCLFLDFGAAGSEGVRNYKRNLSTEEIKCYQISYNNLPSILKFLKGFRRQIILKALAIKNKRI
jgi:lipid II:glycine glycyltransferase (peptidoglycan interpeptide bridge formation enzyme)